MFLRLFCKQFLKFISSPTTSYRKKINSGSHANLKIIVTEPKDLILNSPNKFQLSQDGIGDKVWNVVGRGSFGTVIKGEYKGNLVAIKVVNLGKNAEQDKKKLNESNALNLNHKNIAKTLDIVINNYGLVLMEYYPNSRNLQSVLDSADILSTSRVVQYAVDITTGVKYCHENGILHLDIKPQNILLCEGQVCKICDFGNCVKINESGFSNNSIGTVRYAAPEILKGQNPTTRSDVYSLGITFWQIAARQLPFLEIQDSSVVIYKVVKFRFRPNVALIVELGEDFVELCQNAWQDNPADRPETGQLLSKLQMFK